MNYGDITGAAHGEARQRFPLPRLRASGLPTTRAPDLALLHRVKKQITVSSLQPAWGAN